jgi:hypothetical protein
MMILKPFAVLTFALAMSQTSPAAAQQCVAGASPTPQQMARRTQGLRATRTVNNLEANQPGSATMKYLHQSELPTSAFAAKSNADEFLKTLNFTPGEDLMPGWTLTLDLTPEGYWFMIKDKTDPCGFAFVSNQNGLIFQAQPIQ